MMKKEELIGLALGAREKAYAPYSHYHVGAAVLTCDGRVFTGCNIENASYGATICAERTAILRAVCEGAKKIEAIAIAGGMWGEEIKDYAFPCGICRQVMKEFGGDDLKIYVARSEKDYQEFTLSELLPHGFGGDLIK